MANSENTILNSSKSASAAPPHLGPSQDLMSAQMMLHKLDGMNYLAWSQFVRLYITGKGKLGYLTDDKPQPKATDPTFTSWVEENAMLMTWLLQTMTLDVSTGYMRLPIAKDIWDAVAQTYSVGSNDAQIYDLKRRVHETTQKGKSLSAYFTALQALWQELDIITNHVFSKIPIPSLREVYAHVRAEELRRTVMLLPTSQEGSALASSVHQPAILTGNSRGDKDALSCDYCNKTRQTRATCFKLHPHLQPSWYSAKGSSSKQGGRTSNGSSSKAHFTASDVSAKYPPTQIEQMIQECARILLTKEASSSSTKIANSDKSWDVFPVLELENLHESLPETEDVQNIMEEDGEDMQHIVTRPSHSLEPYLQVYSRREKAHLDHPHDQSSTPVTGNPESISYMFFKM
ncbi:hypothetical protein F0562_003894 [Nyssa sinensis]|uniref:Retrotransposon Copia-like N-terminal domain-containing protein n=1 Tax=Nyssa sinensis TaxID=561372 RepID=A0A5J5C016_9ASTE|nr:hypothetical protein F0562_003894 [Nyssa sinensis]